LGILASRAARGSAPCRRRAGARIDDRRNLDTGALQRERRGVGRSLFAKITARVPWSYRVTLDIGAQAPASIVPGRSLFA
jgi:hypothetical protein